MQCEFESLLGHHKCSYDIVGLFVSVGGVKQHIADIQVQVTENSLLSVNHIALDFDVLDTVTIEELGVQWHTLYIPAEQFRSMVMPTGSEARIQFDTRLVRLVDG